MLTPPSIFLLTDFGAADHYVAVVKAVILTRCPGTPLIDITHGVAPQAIEQGAYLLESVWPWLPTGSVILAVVDPGVGTSREPAVFYHEDKTVIGPNNGLLSFLPRDLVGRVLDRPQYWLEQISDTFHGRDIFSPCAAHVAAGGHWTLLGNQPTTPVAIADVSAIVTGARHAGRIIHFDHFGNAITSLKAADVADAKALSIEIPAILRCPILRTYAAVEEKHPLGYIGSTGRLEIAVRGGNAQKTLGLTLNDSVYLLETTIVP